MGFVELFVQVFRHAPAQPPSHDQSQVIRIPPSLKQSQFILWCSHDCLYTLAISLDVMLVTDSISPDRAVPFSHGTAHNDYVPKPTYNDGGQCT